MPNSFQNTDAYDIGIKIGTFNLRNFAKAGFQFYENQDPYSPQEYNDKIAWTAAQIDKINADIIVFQEVFHIDALTDAVKASRTMRHAKIIGRDAVAMPPKNSLVP